MSRNIKEHFQERVLLIEQAIDTHGSYLQNYLTGLAKNQHDAEELFDDLWLHVLHKFDEDKMTDLGCLRRKAYQLFVDWWRKKQRNPITVFEEPPDTPAPSNITEPLTDEEEEAFKKRFFSEYNVDLTEDQKTALWLHARMGYTFVEIGQIMNKSQSTVGDWIKQARSAFATDLDRS